MLLDIIHHLVYSYKKQDGLLIIDKMMENVQQHINCEYLWL
jgi:hypothetical protein